MTHLRRIVLEELQRRHYSEGTTRYYIRHVEKNGTEAWRTVVRRFISR